VTQRVVHFGDGTATAVTANGNITGNLRYVQGRNNQNDFRVQIMAGTNTYTGNTTVNSGTLLINGSNTGGGAFTVNGKTTSGSAGILGGNGSINVGVNDITIGDAVASSSAGRLQAGSAALTIGTLTTTAASLNFLAESIFTVDLNTISGNTIDLVNHTGSVSTLERIGRLADQQGGLAEVLGAKTLPPQRSGDRDRADLRARVHRNQGAHADLRERLRVPERPRLQPGRLLRFQPRSTESHTLGGPYRINIAGRSPPWPRGSPQLRSWRRPPLRRRSR
jgi:autotransporter-associated beta strand protein